MYGQQLARVEEDLLRALGKLEEVLHSAGPASELDDVAALHGGRGHLDVGCQRAAWCPLPHRCTSEGAVWPDIE
ncbi:hypothetical protein BM536_012405 [Streptomyces phaeoluteigriseus]|uniref:Uncharacterized protein n=1 Tax=Streptomyces phaeoluteigriseus TaxID=114686 RepID=A0A1V6MSD1_9ACTN|nr:hypothetical protein BM536_012405 [Streptomyces phaeoluteigriseus]